MPVETDIQQPTAEGDQQPVVDTGGAGDRNQADGDGGGGGGGGTVLADTTSSDPQQSALLQQVEAQVEHQTPMETTTTNMVNGGTHNKVSEGLESGGVVTTVTADTVTTAPHQESTKEVKKVS
ncbi:unnamed protein product, partial [Meganyctiphanes norvegica]